MLKKMKLFIIVNVDWFFLSHRKEIAMAAHKAGYDVSIIAKDTGRRKQIEELGLNFIDLHMDRKNGNPIQDLRAIVFLMKIFKQSHPDIVHNVGLKVVLISGVAAMLAHVNAVVSAISGLGITFSVENQSKISTRILAKILKIVHSGYQIKAIFQNTEDKAIFEKNKITNVNQSILIKGSGVNLERFSFTKDPISARIKIILTARMIVDKGILVLVEAARRMKTEYGDSIQFLLCGGLDDNPNSLSEDDMNEIIDGEYIRWLGHRTDVELLLAESNIVVLPSYYKEGLPKSLIEAAATGKPIVTTDSVGCRDAVIEGKNGFLIPIKDPKQLVQKLKLLIDNREMRIAFGKNSRAHAEANFSIQSVVKYHLGIYSKISGR
jgi:glycosyltransferase involved in cell wall biosynthesis